MRHGDRSLAFHVEMTVLSRRASRWLAPAFLLLGGVLGGSGCAHSVKQIARESSGAVIDESVDQLTDDKNTQQIASALADPRIEDTIRKVTDQVISGVLGAVGSAEAQKQLATLTATATRAVSTQLVATLGSPRTQEQLALMTGAITQQVLHQVTTTMHDAMPVVRETLARDVS